MDRPKDYQPGEMVPGTVYRIVRMIGAGGMGTVYDVEDTTVGKRYVLKTLHPELYSRQDLAKRMQAEARTLARLSHPNIVEVVTAGATTDDLRLPFYVMEKLNGQNLRTILSKKGSLDLPHALHIGIDLLDALDNAHDKGVIHRDVKPDNIFLHRNSNGVTTTKLLDFGIMRLLDAGPGVTAGRFMGTLRYAAPEQLRGDPLSAQTDLYAAGLVVYEMIAGQGPFDDLKDPNKIAAAHINTVPPPVLQFGAVVPEALERLLRGALSKEATKRPKDAFTFAAQLRNMKRTLAMEKPSESVTSRPTAVPVAGPATLGPGSADAVHASASAALGPTRDQPLAPPVALAPTEHANTRADAGVVRARPPPEAPLALEPLPQTTVVMTGGMIESPTSGGPTLIVPGLPEASPAAPIDRSAETHSAVPPPQAGSAGSPSRRNDGSTEPMPIVSASAPSANAWRAPGTLRMTPAPPGSVPDDPSSQLLALLPIQESDGVSSHVAASSTVSPGSRSRVSSGVAMAIGLAATVVMVGGLGVIAWEVTHRGSADSAPPSGPEEVTPVTAPAEPPPQAPSPSPSAGSVPVPSAAEAPVPAPTIPPPLDVPPPSPAPRAGTPPRSHGGSVGPKPAPPPSPTTAPTSAPPSPAKLKLPGSGL
jgi:eukaryotic-like serine/threonine-protein kinase